jgi:hypothetical protein
MHHTYRTLGRGDGEYMSFLNWCQDAGDKFLLWRMPDSLHAWSFLANHYTPSTRLPMAYTPQHNSTLTHEYPALSATSRRIDPLISGKKKHHYGFVNYIQASRWCIDYRVSIGGGDEQVMQVWRKRRTFDLPVAGLAGGEIARPAHLDQVEIEKKGSYQCEQPH